MFNSMFTIQIKTGDTWTDYAVRGDLIQATDAWRAACRKGHTVRILNGEGRVIHG